jgi:uncharacterized protein (TIGR02284 family)
LRERFLLDSDRYMNQPGGGMNAVATIATLNKLVRTCRDAEWLCTSWGRKAASPHLCTRLRNRAEEWGRQADELQALVLLLGGEPATSATLSAGLKSLWLECRYTLLGRSDDAALEGCESVQQFALGCYEEALAGYLPQRIRQTVSLQARRISDRCDRPVAPVRAARGPSLKRD